MTFDPAKVPGGDVAGWGERCRIDALAGVQTRDWRRTHDATKSWVGWGGGAWIPDTWLLYAVSALLKGEPRNAVHALDLGIKTWLEGPTDQALLTWCRGMVVWRVLKDPKTALIDLEHAARFLPAWLGAPIDEVLQRCHNDGSRSRKRRPSVEPRPAHAGSDSLRHVVAPATLERRDGDRPAVWDHVAPHLLG